LYDPKHCFAEYICRLIISLEKENLSLNFNGIILECSSAQLEIVSTAQLSRLEYIYVYV